jgi:hypothetical protein
MITTYLLKNCKYCKELIKYIHNNPNLNMCLIIVSKDDIDTIKKNEPRITEFPVSFVGNPKINGKEVIANDVIELYISGGVLFANRDSQKLCINSFTIII